MRRPVADNRVMRTDLDAIKATHPRAYEPWDEIDEAIIRAMMQARSDTKQIADAVGRTEAEIRAYLEAR